MNVGCVPKKVMWVSSFGLRSQNAATIAETIAEAPGYGFNIKQEGSYAWEAVKNKRDAYISRLNGIYTTNLAKDSIKQIFGHAEFVDSKTVRVNEETFTAKVNPILSDSSAHSHRYGFSAVDTRCSRISGARDH